MPPGRTAASLEGVLLAVIGACEIGFWVVLVAGLVARYRLRLRRLSAVLLVCLPLIEVVLFVATIVDLRQGATANVTHGLAAAYIGFSVAFGHDMVRWADQWYAHRFAGGPRPWKPPKGGWPRARYEWREWFKALLGWAVSCALLGGGMLIVDDWHRAQALAEWVGRLSIVLVIWLVFWPVWYTVTAVMGSPQGAAAPAAGDPEGGDRGGERGDREQHGQRA